MKQSVWEKLMVERLRTIEIKKKAYASTLEQLERLNDRAYQMKGPVTDSTPVSGGALNREEERRLNNIALREEIDLNLDTLAIDIDLHNKTWRELTKQEQTVLTYFYIDRPPNYIDQLVNLLHFERSTIYNIKDEALYKLTMLTYGSK